MGILTGALHPLGMLLLAAAGAACLCLLASLGTWLSVVCRNTLWARMSAALTVGLVFLGAWLALMNSPGAMNNVWEPDPARFSIHLRQVGLNPLAAWWVAGFSWDEGAQLLTSGDKLLLARLKAVGAGSLVAAAAAGVFWIGARQRFGKL